MPTLNDITTAAWRLLDADSGLTGLCTVYKGPRRPRGSSNPAVTIDAARLEHGAGEGLWMCDLTATVYADTLAGGMPDHAVLDAIGDRIRAVLADTELALDRARALPLIEGGSTGPTWETPHGNEMKQELTFGLLFVKFA